MKRNPAEDKPDQYHSDEDDEESEDNENDDNEDNWAASTLVPANRPPGTGGKQPVSAPNNPAATSKPPPRPATAGKQPISTANIPAQPKPPGTGGKQPDLSPEKIAAMKKGANPANTQLSKPPTSSTAGKGPTAYANASAKIGTGASTTTRPGTGGKEPQTRYQTSLASSHLRAGANQKRPQTNKKQHYLIGKTVKVFYVPEGYFTGLVKSKVGESEFMISWDDGSTTSAVLREEDETEDPDNEDRWSIVEDYETPVNRVPEKPVNGGRTQKPTPKPAPPPQQTNNKRQAQTTTYEEEDENDPDDPDDNDNDPED